MKINAPGQGQFWHQGQNLNNFDRGPMDDIIKQTSNLCTFKQWDFLIFLLFFLQSENQ
jgi:hypothetical protein